LSSGLTKSEVNPSGRSPNLLATRYTLLATVLLTAKSIHRLAKEVTDSVLYFVNLQLVFAVNTA
jgi:hypothetical protein